MYIYIYLVSSNSFLYAIIFGRKYIKVYFFSIFITNRIIKSFLAKETLSDTTILSMFTFFIKMGSLC